jgi:uncharacterized protein (TIGR03083 family)
VGRVDAANASDPVDGSDVLGAADALGASDVAGASDPLGASEVVGAFDVAGASDPLGASEVVGASDPLSASDVVGASEVVGAADLLGASEVVGAFVAEAAALSHALAGLPEAGWSRPTRCAPWDVRDLLAHLRMVVGRLPGMLADPGDGLVAEVSAVDYYRPDHRFSPTTNATRIATAQADPLPGPALAAVFATEWRRAAALCEQEPATRVVRTRHGDPMLLTEFLKTRVVELAVHGFDLADAVPAPAWLTPRAAAVLQELLLGPGRTAADPEHFLRAATGRAEDPGLLARLRPRDLTLG